MEGREGRDGNAEWDEPCACAVRGVVWEVCGRSRSGATSAELHEHVGGGSMEESSISGPRVIVVLSVAAIALLNFRSTIVLSDLTSHVSRATTRAEMRGGPGCLSVD